jgi:hypothetical protein
VLLPSDTHRKPITSITAVLLPFVTYLLTLPLMYTILIGSPERKKPLKNLYKLGGIIHIMDHNKQSVMMLIGFI